MNGLVEQHELPIGVFDSGIGGLTVVREIRKQLPDERVIYFGDTARCPYGDRDPDEIRSFSIQVCDFLREQGVKLLVVACNTATAAALPDLQARYDVPVVGVVRPGARAAVQASKSLRIGIIGTAVTVASGAYDQAVREFVSSAEVYSLACPEFVPLVERGEWDGPRVRKVVQQRLLPLAATPMDTLILGCTHYPLLQPVIQDVLGPRVRLISSAEETAREVQAILRESGLERTSVTGTAEYWFYTSGDGVHMRFALKHWLGLEDKEGQVQTVDLHPRAVT
ncbi:MAG: glutamate racemase [Alicyclobacillus sp.]|nr:glutamate racemase [Alicyclobacillus sp.]